MKMGEQGGDAHKAAGIMASNEGADMCTGLGWDVGYQRQGTVMCLSSCTAACTVASFRARAGAAEPPLRVLYV